MASLLHAKVVNKWSDRVTHVITDVQRGTRRTIKILFGVLAGAWIVSADCMYLMCIYLFEENV